MPNPHEPTDESEDSSSPPPEGDERGPAGRERQFAEQRGAQLRPRDAPDTTDAPEAPEEEPPPPPSRADIMRQYRQRQQAPKENEP